MDSLTLSKTRSATRFFMLKMGLFLIIAVSANQTQVRAGEPDSYEQLKAEFLNPDPAKWGEVPLWWWEGAPLSRERITWQLETLSEKGVKSVCPIQRSPGRCAPASFSPEWWDMLEYTHTECERLGMSLWVYDQVGYGYYGWLEKAAAKVEGSPAKKLEFIGRDVEGGETVDIDLPSGQLLHAAAYKLEGGSATEDTVHDLASSVDKGALQWDAPSGQWRIALSIAVPFKGFYLDRAATASFIDMLYGEIERRLGGTAMGSSFAGVFQDEHPPTPRDVYSAELGRLFRDRHGYGIGNAIPALHFDLGRNTPKYRTDFYDTYLELVEKTYWKPIFDWAEDRGVLTSHDNWGRRNIMRQSRGYIDYFRTQRWFSAPGYDDAGQRDLTKRNYYDTKIAASIARLYDRPRVWVEAFHSAGWGRTTQQTLEWLTANYAFGANLYNEHGLYYSTNASTWEHAAPDPHWLQPYWRYYDRLSDWVGRMSYLMTQGNHVVDVAVHYPIVSLLSEVDLRKSDPDYNTYMNLSRAIYNAEMDNDIIDDDSILKGEIVDGRLKVAGNGYQALVFGPENIVRRSVVAKALKLVKAGGTVVFYGRLPQNSAEGGRGDPELTSLFSSLFGQAPNRIPQMETSVNRFESGGSAVFMPDGDGLDMPAVLSRHISRDIIVREGDFFVAHRRIGETDVYLFQNVEKRPVTLEARLRVNGVPERWDAMTGDVKPVDAFHREDGFTHITQKIRGNGETLIIVRPGARQKGQNPAAFAQATEKDLSPDWKFSVIPTRDNKWGAFRWPPSEDRLGPEIRQFRYMEESGTPGVRLGWHTPDFDDREWSRTLYSTGPYWLALAGVPKEANIISEIEEQMDDIAADQKISFKNQFLQWKEILFSQTIGLGKPVPWGGHSGYPDGHMDRNFIDLPEGRKILFTRIRSQKEQRLGLHIALRNSQPKLWVNGEAQPVEGAIGNLPLRAGVNTVLLDVPDGGRGMLYVQETPPSATSIEEAREVLMPDFKDSSWIWSGDTDAIYLRKEFTLKRKPVRARLAVTAYTGYRLFINGEMVAEEIGPWARWQKPEMFNVAPYLRRGENAVAVWGQFFSGQHSSAKLENRAVAVALKYAFDDGEEGGIVTDDGWKATDKEHDDWQAIEFDASDWDAARVKGQMGDRPWGDELLANLGKDTTPHRPLSVNLSSPYLQVFRQGPQVVYDVKQSGAKRIGWYRFSAPPGLARIDLHAALEGEAWVDGIKVPVRQGVIAIDEPPAGVSTVAMRLEMESGQYAGAAFPEPPSVSLEGGTIQTGRWEHFALPTYSGIGVYSQSVEFTAEEVGRQIELDLGNVLVAAEVLVNGKSAGVRLAAPYAFDLTGLVEAGKNELEVRVANTIAPHYLIPRKSTHLGPTDSGLIGPVKMTLLESP